MTMMNEGWVSAEQFVAEMEFALNAGRAKRLCYDDRPNGGYVQIVEHRGQTYLHEFSQGKHSVGPVRQDRIYETGIFPDGFSNGLVKPTVEATA